MGVGNGIFSLFFRYFSCNQAAAPLNTAVLTIVGTFLRSWWIWSIFNSTRLIWSQTMALTTEQKKDILKTHATGTKDTGSAQVQVALLTARINQLGGHFQTHTKDHHSRRGLLKLVGQRRRMLNYLERKDVDAYKKLIGELGLRK
jgi:small subunit ribosomal protein S15